MLRPAADQLRGRGGGLPPRARRRRRDRFPGGHRRRHGLAALRGPAPLRLRARRADRRRLPGGGTALPRPRRSLHPRMYARLKFVVHRLGIGRCRQLVDEILDRRARRPPPDRSGGGGGLRPRRARAAAGGRRPPRQPTAWPSSRSRSPRASWPPSTCQRIAELAEMLRRQARLQHQSPEPRAARRAAAAGWPSCRSTSAAWAWKPTDFYGLSDVVSCVGTTYCPLAVSATHHMFDLLQDLVHAEKYAPIRGGVLLNITGCPNSCSPYRIADIGLRGLRIRGQTGSADGYQVTVGGTQSRFGQPLGEFKTADCPRVVAAILDTFLAIRQGDESLARQRGPNGHRALSRRRRGPGHRTTKRRSIRWSCRSSAARARTPLDRKTLAPRRALPRGLPGRDQHPRVHPPHRPGQLRRSPPHQPGRQRSSRACWGGSAPGPAKAAAATSGPASRGRCESAT